jgi:hypothetical protein
VGFWFDPARYVRHHRAGIGARRWLAGSFFILPVLGSWMSAFAGAVPPLTRSVFAWVDTGLSRLPVSWVTGLFAFCVIFAVLQGCLYMVSWNQRK